MKNQPIPLKELLKVLSYIPYVAIGRQQSLAWEKPQSRGVSIFAVKVHSEGKIVTQREEQDCFLSETSVPGSSFKYWPKILYFHEELNV